MKNVIKKISSIALAFALLGTGTGVKNYNTVTGTEHFNMSASAQKLSDWYNNGMPEKALLSQNDASSESDSEIMLTAGGRELKYGDGINIRIRDGFSIKTSIGSIGYRATLNGVKGFVTCNHVVSNSDDGIVYTSDSKPFGFITKLGKGVDAAFVKITSNGYTINNKDRVYSFNISSVATPKKGDSVFVVGRYTNGIGKYDKISGGLYKIDGVGVKGGDSGGLAYIENGGKRKIIGIIGGVHVENNRTYNISYIIPVTDIQKKLGAVAY